MCNSCVLSAASIDTMAQVNASHNHTNKSRSRGTAGTVIVGIFRPRSHWQGSLLGPAIIWPLCAM